VTANACGYGSHRVEDRSRARPVALELWYPASPNAVEHDHDYGLGSGLVAEDADCAEARFPLVVLSHGAFGSAGSYAWISEHLARAGYVVCGVSHYGESPVYGPETIDPRSVLEVDPRAEDCSFAIDHVLGESAFRDHVESDRIGALGHSSGGATAVALAGGVFEPSAMRRYCASGEARGDRGCAYDRDPSRPQASAGPPPRSLRDPRVRAAVALDPALGPGFGTGALASISIPCHVVGAVDNDFLPFEAHAARYARLIPRCSLTRLADGEGHFVFLNACESDLEANGVPLCRDRAGVDREAVHRRLLGVVEAFFGRSL
jgi:predicted dienelactone hydrolase